MGSKTKKRKLPMLWEGLLFGIPLGIIELILFIIGSLTQVSFIDAIAIILAIIAFYFAGRRAAEQTGYTGTGTQAGVCAAIISALFLFVGYLIFTYLDIDTLRQIYQTTANNLGLDIQYTRASMIQLAIVTDSFSLFVSIVGGLVVGAIGGYQGKHRF